VAFTRAAQPNDPGREALLAGADLEPEQRQTAVIHKAFALTLVAGVTVGLCVLLLDDASPLTLRSVGVVLLGAMAAAALVAFVTGVVGGVVAATARERAEERRRALLEASWGVEQRPPPEEAPADGGQPRQPPRNDP
jgi:hypothetical protein